VDGYGYALAGDTGSAIKGNRIDVMFSTHEEALAWGLRKSRSTYLNDL
jgi:3D (Asp-Asp-Asp) domain-containing protein